MRLSKRPFHGVTVPCGVFEREFLFTRHVSDLIDRMHANGLSQLVIYSTTNPRGELTLHADRSWTLIFPAVSGQIHEVQERLGYRQVVEVFFTVRHPELMNPKALKREAMIEFNKQAQPELDALMQMMEEKCAELASQEVV